MKNLLIIGARGFGRGVYHLFMDCVKFGSIKDVECKGFLDSNKDALNGYSGYPPIISSVEDYIVGADDVEYVQELALVFVHSLCLYVKERVRIQEYALFFV